MHGELERIRLGSAACQLKPRDLVVKEGFIGNVGERRSAPESERFAQGLNGDGRILIASAVDERFELVYIDATQRGAKPVAPWVSDDGVRAERVAKPRD